MPQFRAKARAVDLLGKGQIADLPTAISELWKNGYDAYGDNLQSFLYMPGYHGNVDPIFVISDDGKGMSKADILNKWFILGTDSKSRNDRDIQGIETLYKEPRIKMGEKGIGRLAVAYLGPQMLMLTKKLNHPLEAVFFDWRILENYDLFLEDINIPNRTIESKNSIKSIFEELRNEFLLNFPPIKSGKEDPWKDQQELKNSIIQDCQKIQLPHFVIENQIADLVSDPTKTHATRFIIFNPDQQILELKNFTKNDEGNDLKDDNTVAHTVSALAALFNLFKTENPKHKTSFWINNEDGPFDLLNFKSFFTPTDFENCDHMIDGSFDEFGTFNGIVRIYKKEIKHQFKPIKKLQKNNYGPFALKVGYIMGVKDESSLNDEQWRAYNEKLDLYSGLYIYRDGFRVLPYGRSENDFLEFEERRGRHAGEYFFAKRRMFGYVEITRETNSKLIDKSSREGFVNNTAYRDFKSELISFFKDLAKKYFSTHAEYNYKDEQKEEFRKLAQAEEQEKLRDKEARKLFSKQLKEYPQILDNLETQFNDWIEKLKRKIEDSSLVYEELQSILNNLEQCKIQLHEYNFAKPIRYKPTLLQTKNYQAYRKQFSNFQKVVQDSSSIIQTVRERLKVHELFKEFEANYALFFNTLNGQFLEYENRLSRLIDKFEKELLVEKENVLTDFETKYKEIIPSKTDVKEIQQSLKLLEAIFNETRDRISTRVTPYLQHLDRLSFDVNEDNLVGYYKLQFEEMKEEWNKTYELAQLGIAVEIIDHQFNTLYSQLSENILSLKDNLIIGKESERKYKQLLNAFHHLEDNYKLLQPLYRTTGRIRKDVTGKELYDYALDFFENRLKENKISFKITNKATIWTEFTYESIFKPVLINIINNAIYWLQPVDNKEIKIDLVDKKLLILNSGVSIEDHILDDIFKLFFSERPKGRGIGLYLAKKSLNGIGYDIYATNNKELNYLNGACFVIEPIKKA